MKNEITPERLWETFIANSPEVPEEFQTAMDQIGRAMFFIGVLTYLQAQTKQILAHTKDIQRLDEAIVQYMHAKSLATFHPKDEHLM